MTAMRRLAVILAADVAGYSRLMGADQEVNPVVKDNSGTHHGSS
jgi:class 3 adenylate cyclase